MIPSQVVNKDTEGLGAPFEIESTFPAECWVWRFEDGLAWSHDRARMVSVSAKGIFTAAAKRFGLTATARTGDIQMSKGWPDKANSDDFVRPGVEAIALLDENGVEIARRWMR